MATITAAAGGGTWTAGGTWVGGIAPTAADDAVLTSTSGNVTISGAAVCRSLDCTGYTGTLTHAAASSLTIGDGTAGAGNVVLKLVAGMTYTLGNSTTSTITFVSTSVTQQTITSGGKSLGTGTLTTGNYLLTDAMVLLGLFNFNGGTFNTGSQACTWAAFQSNGSATPRTLTLGSSSITLTQAGAPGWEHPGATTMTANTATVTFSAAASSVFDVYGKNMNGLSLVFNGGTAQILNGCIINNFTYNGVVSRTGTVLLSGDVTTTDTFTVTGNSVLNRVLVYSNIIGTVRTVTAGAVSFSHTDFQDITGAGTASWNLSAITGGSGNCGGNNGITFTTSAAQTWQGTVGGNWSDVTKWTSRVPLPQDDVIVNAAFAASQTINMEMPRAGRSIDFTGTSGGVTINPNSTTVIYGSLNLTNVGVMGGSSPGWTFSGRGSYTITCAGLTFAKQLSFIAPGGTYTLQDSLTTTGLVNIGGGTFNTNNQTITSDALSINTSGTIANIGNSTINLTTTLTFSTLVRFNSAVMNVGNATINIVNASSSPRSIGMSGVNASSATINYTVPGSTGALVLFGSFSINTLNVSDTANARTLLIQSGTTITVANAFNVNGAAGRPITIAACNASGVQTAGTAGTVLKTSSFVNCDYLSLQDSTATGGASWYAGVNSTNVSNNTGWFFQAYGPSKFLELM